MPLCRPTSLLPRAERRARPTLQILRFRATVFVTKQWLGHNPVGTAVLLPHPDPFELEDHEEKRVSSVMS
jgi:peptidoglycan/xylan/chitin deacetylase (PgdA/CDA1 family)